MAFNKNKAGYLRDIALAKRIWPGRISLEQMHSLRCMSQKLGLSVAAGDVQLLENRWYVTHSGLLRLARRRQCSGIAVNLVRASCDPAVSRWVFRAVVYPHPNSKGFVGYGDADPSNVSVVMHGAELRIAETRAVNRALRKAYGIGLCSVEELGAVRASPAPPPLTNGLHSSNGQPRLRDQLCLLIRQYNLDANLVKAYAADFCGTETLRGASRELVESFISHLSTAAKENREALICKLNSYSQRTEATS
jgi:hypothetical protein